METSSRPSLKKFAGPAAVLGLMAIAYGLGLHRYLSLETIAINREALKTYTANHQFTAIFVYVAIYIAVVALSVPGAVVITIAGGLLFGWFLGGVATVIAASTGATIIFQIAKSSFGTSLQKRAGPFLSKLKNGFAEDAFNYLLFLRLVPLFPFWLVNIAPAFANVGLRAFVAATVLGILPGTFAFSFVGAGLDSVIDAQNTAHKACVAAKTLAQCPFNLSPSDLVTKELIIAGVVMGLVALLPIALKKWKAAK